MFVGCARFSLSGSLFSTVAETIRFAAVKTLTEMVEPLPAELEPAFGGEAFGWEGAARIENYSSNRLYQNLTL